MSDVFMLSHTNGLDRDVFPDGAGVKPDHALVIHETSSGCCLSYQSLPTQYSSPGQQSDGPAQPLKQMV